MRKFSVFVLFACTFLLAEDVKDPDPVTPAMKLSFVAAQRDFVLESQRYEQAKGVLIAAQNDIDKACKAAGKVFNDKAWDVASLVCSPAPVTPPMPNSKVK
jgi:phage-related baseplate assembly protein